MNYKDRYARLRARRGEDENGNPVQELRKTSDNAVQSVIDAVERHFVDIVENPESPEAYKECWTLCVDAAQQLGLSGDVAISVAEAACARLGYPRNKSESMKLNENYPSDVDVFRRAPGGQTQEPQHNEPSQATSSFEFMGHFVEVHHNTGADGGLNQFIAFIDYNPEEQTVADTIEQCAANAKAVCHQLQPSAQVAAENKRVKGQASVLVAEVLKTARAKKK